MSQEEIQALTSTVEKMGRVKHKKHSDSDTMITDEQIDKVIESEPAKTNTDTNTGDKTKSKVSTRKNRILTSIQ